MKRTLTPIVIVTTLLFAASCNKETPAPVIPDGPGTVNVEEQCELRISLRSNDSPTKVLTQDDYNETAIQNVQVWVFHSGLVAESGELDITASFGFDRPLNETDGEYDPEHDEIRVKCSTGERHIYVVCNDYIDRTRDSTVRFESDLLNMTTEIRNSGPDRIFMFGHAKQTLYQGEVKVDIAVDRLLSAIVLQSVTNDIYSVGYQTPGSFRLVDCYLINVPAVNTFRGNLSPSLLPEDQWYARRAKETDPSRMEFICSLPVTKILEYGETDRTEHTFYSFANSCAVSTDEEWSPRATLLVVETEFWYDGGWLTRYYPIALTDSSASPGIKANTKYLVNLTIHRPGASRPDEPVAIIDCTADVSIVPWTKGEPYNPVF